MRPADDISDVTLIRTFREARKTMGEAAALRHVIAEAGLFCTESTPQTVMAVADEVALQMGIPGGGISLFKRPSRHGAKWKADPTYHARRVAWWVTHMEFDVTLQTLGTAYRGRCHSTILHVLDTFQERMVDSPDLQALVASVTAAVWRQLGRKAAA